MMKFLLYLSKNHDCFSIKSDVMYFFVPVVEIIDFSVSVDKDKTFQKCRFKLVNNESIGVTGGR